jgi:hypothetical protein
VKLIDSRDVWLRECAAPVGTKAFLRVEGERTHNVLLSNSDLRNAEKPLDSTPDLAKQVVFSGNVLPLTA